MIQGWLGRLHVGIGILHKTAVPFHQQNRSTGARDLIAITITKKKSEENAAEGGCRKTAVGVRAMVLANFFRSIRRADDSLLDAGFSKRGVGGGVGHFPDDDLGIRSRFEPRIIDEKGPVCLNVKIFFRVIHGHDLYIWNALRVLSRRTFLFLLRSPGEY